jgi:hypothetical protein
MTVKQKSIPKSLSTNLLSFLDQKFTAHINFSLVHYSPTPNRPKSIFQLTRVLPIIDKTHNQLMKSNFVPAFIFSLYSCALNFITILLTIFNAFPNNLGQAIIIIIAIWIPY